jgi:hypothetical protein
MYGPSPFEACASRKHLRMTEKGIARGEYWFARDDIRRDQTFCKLTATGGPALMV